MSRDTLLNQKRGAAATHTYIHSGERRARGLGAEREGSTADGRGGGNAHEIQRHVVEIQTCWCTGGAPTCLDFNNQAVRDLGPSEAATAT